MNSQVVSWFDHLAHDSWNLCGGRNMLRCAKCVQFQTHLARSHKFNINIFTDASISPKWWLCRISASCFHLFQVFKSSTENERNALFSFPSRDLLASTMYKLKNKRCTKKLIRQLRSCYRPTQARRSWNIWDQTDDDEPWESVGCLLCLLDKWNDENISFLLMTFLVYELLVLFFFEDWKMICERKKWECKFTCYPLARMSFDLKHCTIGISFEFSLIFLLTLFIFGE